VVGAQDRGEGGEGFRDHGGVPGTDGPGGDGGGDDRERRRQLDPGQGAARAERGPGFDPGRGFGGVDPQRLGEQAGGGTDRELGRDPAGSPIRRSSNACSRRFSVSTPLSSTLPNIHSILPEPANARKATERSISSETDKIKIKRGTNHTHKRLNTDRLTFRLTASGSPPSAGAAVSPR
jgi:hypothetical protein